MLYKESIDATFALLLAYCMHNFLRFSRINECVFRGLSNFVIFILAALLNRESSPEGIILPLE